MLFLGAGVGGVIVGLGVGSIHVAKKYKTTALILNFAFLGIGSAITPFYVNAASAGGWLGMGCLIWGGCFALQFIFALMNRTIKRLVVSLKRYETFSHMVTFWKDIPKAFWLIALAVFFYSISEVTFWDWGVIYLKEAKALTAAQAGDASAFYWVAATIADVFFALIFLKYNYKLYHRLIPILILVSYLFLITSTGLSALLLSLALAGFSCTLFFPLSVRLASETYPKIETRVFGFLLSIYFLGSGLSTYLIGLFRGSLSISISKGFFIIPLAALLTLLLLNLFYIRRSKPAA
jgi:fucose permease